MTAFLHQASSTKLPPPRFLHRAHSLTAVVATARIAIFGIFTDSFTLTSMTTIRRRIPAEKIVEKRKCNFLQFREAEMRSGSVLTHISFHTNHRGKRVSASTPSRDKWRVACMVLQIWRVACMVLQIQRVACMVLKNHGVTCLVLHQQPT